MERRTRATDGACLPFATMASKTASVARIRYRGIVCAGLAAVVSIALTPSAGAKTASVSCAGYNGPPATWAYFSHVKASGVSCTLAEKLIRALYVGKYAASDLLTLGTPNQHVVFAKKVHDDTAGFFDLRLVGQLPKYGGDTVSMNVFVGSGLPDPNGHQVP